MTIYTVREDKDGARVIPVEAKETAEFFVFRNSDNPWYQGRIAKRNADAAPTREGAIQMARGVNERYIARLEEQLARARALQSKLARLA